MVIKLTADEEELKENPLLSDEVIEIHPEGNKEETDNSSFTLKKHKVKNIAE